jgi:hypothetical protein
MQQAGWSLAGHGRKPPYRGITRAKGHRHTGWQAQIQVGGEKYTWPKRPKDPEDAARIYDVMALYLHGPDAALNFDGRPPAWLTRAAVKQFLIDRGAISPDAPEPSRFSSLPVDAI